MSTVIIKLVAVAGVIVELMGFIAITAAAIVVKLETAVTIAIAGVVSCL